MADDACLPPIVLLPSLLSWHRAQSHKRATHTASDVLGLPTKGLCAALWTCKCQALCVHTRDARRTRTSRAGRFRTTVPGTHSSLCVAGYNVLAAFLALFTHHPVTPSPRLP